jgi:hypothetical protein
MIRKLKSGVYRLYSRKADPKTGRRRNLGTFKTRAAAEQHERAVQYFKRRSQTVSMRPIALSRVGKGARFAPCPRGPVFAF